MTKRMWTHEGVYAAIVNMIDGHSCLLTVRKTRGPYTGLLDLPGGSPEPGESREVTLQRELDEEIGTTAAACGPWRWFELHVDRDSHGRPIEFHHRGWWCRADLTGQPQPQKAQDVDGLNWCRLDDPRAMKELSPLARFITHDVHPYTAHLGTPVQAFPPSIA